MIVIGAGPGGNAASYQLAKAGLKVLLLEKFPLPRKKTCGGGVPPKALRYIPYDISPVIHKSITGAWLGYQDDGVFLREMDNAGYMVERAEFDHFMTKKAETIGVEVRDNCQLQGVEQIDGLVKINTKCGWSATSKVLIAADGVLSKTRSCIFPMSKPRLGWALESLLWFDDDRISHWGDNCLFDFGGIPNGYAWIFPKKDHLNIGVYRCSESAHNKDLRTWLDRFVLRNPVLHDAKKIDTRGFPIPLEEVAPNLCHGNVIFIGDAGGLGESFYGEGITFALWSAQIASLCVIEYFKDGTSLDNYDRRLRPLRSELRSSRKIASLFHGAPRLCYHHLVRNHYVNHLFANLITGKISYTECLWKTIAFFPAWVFDRRYQMESDYWRKSWTLPTEQVESVKEELSEDHTA